MIRKLAFALTFISLSFTGVVHALGLGEVKVQSNLNQALKAQIQLTNVGGLTDAEILPGLATREEFLRAGVDRVYFLSDIRFSVEVNSDGEAVVLLTTKKPVREPFLNFLVEVIWPSGRLLREYALLVDPPLFAQDKIVAAKAAPSQAFEQTQATPVASATPVATSGDNLALNSVTPNQGALAGNASYGPTTSKDTLWTIALDARPSRGVSPQQVMLAIQDLNPDAFIDGNINKLKTGQVLRLPSEPQIKARSTSQAINQVIAQNAALRKPKTKSLTSAAKQSGKAASAIDSAPSDELKLVVPDKNSKASDSASSDPSGISNAGSAANDEDLSITLEKLDKANLENQDLSNKMEALEEQLETLQRLLTLKNDQLAGLQGQMRANDIAEAEAEQNAEAEAANDQIEVSDEVSDEVAEAETDALVDVKDEVVTEEVVVSESIVDTKLLNKEGELVAEDVVVDEQVAVVPVEDSAKMKPAKSLSFQDQLFDNLMNNPLYQAGAAAILLVLLVTLLLLARRSAAHEGSLSEAASAEGDDANGDHDDAVDEDTQGFQGEDEDGQEGSEAEAGEPGSGLSADSETEDVIAEADVYIAYGRLDQAATILEQGISVDPVRTDYRLKLLEVYKDSLESDAFDRQYSELEAIQDSGALIAAAQIREEFTQALAAKGSNEPADNASSDVEQLLDEEEAQALMRGDDNNFDFDTVDEGEEAGNVREEPSPEIVAEVEEELEAELDLASQELDIDLDIDLDLDEADAVADDELTSLEIEDQGIDFESVSLDGLDDLEESDDQSEADSIVSDADLDVELEDDFDLTLAEEEGIDSALSDIDLNAELEQETEIDLSDELELEDASSDLELDEESEDSLDAGLELELDESDLEIDIDPETEALTDDLGDGLEEDLSLDLEDDLDLDLDASAESEVASDEEPDAAMLDLGADDDLVVTDETLESAADALGDAESFEPELSESEDFDFLEGTDEASTKLDLARAYIDMGDVDGAREILTEVEQDGSPEQQAQAKELIASIGG